MLNFLGRISHQQKFFGKFSIFFFIKVLDKEVLDAHQGDQMGRIFSYRVIVYFDRCIEN
jgi:hypothetical protein